MQTEWATLSLSGDRWLTRRTQENTATTYTHSHTHRAVLQQQQKVQQAVEQIRVWSQNPDRSRSSMCGHKAVRGHTVTLLSKELYWELRAQLKPLIGSQASTHSKCQFPVLTCGAICYTDGEITQNTTSSWIFQFLWHVRLTSLNPQGVSVTPRCSFRLYIEMVKTQKHTLIYDEHIWNTDFICVKWLLIHQNIHSKQHSAWGWVLLLFIFV